MHLHFVWLAVWVLSPDWLCRKFQFAILTRRLGEAATPEGGRGLRAVPRLSIILYPDICLTTEEKSRKNLSQGIRKVLDLQAPSAIRLVDWPAGPHTVTLLPTSSGYFSSQTFSRINTPTYSIPVTLHTYSPMKMEQTECSETLAFKLQTPVNHSEESIRHSEYGESLKSRLLMFYLPKL
jgi:hypothetical protein